MTFAILLYFIRVIELGLNYGRLREQFIKDTESLIPPSYSSIEEAARANTIFRVFAWPLVDLALIYLRIRSIIHVKFGK